MYLILVKNDVAFKVFKSVRLEGFFGVVVRRGRGAGLGCPTKERTRENRKFSRPPVVISSSHMYYEYRYLQYCTAHIPRLLRYRSVSGSLVTKSVFEYTDICPPRPTDCQRRAPGYFKERDASYQHLICRGPPNMIWAFMQKASHPRAIPHPQSYQVTHKRQWPAL